MKCPKCGSENTVAAGTAYPPAFECKECGLIFTKPELVRDQEF